LSCGYIDWNENGYDACRREIWEELGLNVLELDIDSDGQPWYVNTEPGNNSRENISLHYWWYRLKPFDILPELSGDNCEPGEVEDVRWFPLDEAMRLDLAFTHNDILKRWKAKFSKYLAHFVEAGDFGDTNERK
jgi:8-oxo-dGTP pyrophosphatase MutT (NUDIX family)